jgi:cytochrome c biogenesis protein CcmG/thiol:disulfide interchange protein DsbE
MHACIRPCAEVIRLPRHVLVAMLLVAAPGCEDELAWPYPPRAAPGLFLPDIRGGKGPTLESLQGKVVYVDFWGSWCQPCRQSLPFLNGLRAELGRAEFEVLAINLDEEPEAALAFLDEYDLDYPVLSDRERSTLDAWGVAVVPSSFLVDRGGRIRHEYRGFTEDHPKTIRRRVDALLRESSDVLLRLSESRDR